MDDQERFASKTRRVGECLLWTGSLRAHRNGIPRYGTFYYKGRLRQAHHMPFVFSGIPIPKGMIVHHRCGQTRCVERTHLEITTVRDNTNRELGSNAQKTHCPRGHPYDYTGPGRPRRECRRCKCEHQKAYYRRKKAAGRTPRLTP